MHTHMHSQVRPCITIPIEAEEQKQPVRMVNTVGSVVSRVGRASISGPTWLLVIITVADRSVGKPELSAAKAQSG